MLKGKFMNENWFKNTASKIIKIFAIFCMAFVLIYTAALSSKNENQILDQKEFFIISAVVTLVILAIIFVFINLSPKKSKKNKSKKSSQNLPNFKDQIYKKLSTYQNDPLYIGLNLTIKDIYSLNFNYNFNLKEEKVNDIFEFIYLNIKSNFKKDENKFLFGYENHYKDFDLKNAEIVIYFANLITTWEKIQSLIFKKLNLKDDVVKNIGKKVWNLFVKYYINAYSPATLKRQRGQIAIQIYKNLLYEVLEKNSFQTAENELLKVNKEKRVQVLFEIYESSDKEFLEIYFYDTFYVGEILKSWQKKQMLFEQNRLFYDAINFIFKEMMKNYAKNPMKFSQTSKNEAKKIAKNILKTAFYKSGFIPLKSPLRNGLEVLIYDNVPDFLQSFDYYLDLFCYKFMDKKDKNFKEICYETLKYELNLYNASWLLEKDKEFGKKLFYQILPITLNKI